MFDTVKVEVTKYCGAGGGLSEIQVIKNGRNIAEGCVARASACYAGAEFAADRVVDGVTSSAVFGVGYWLLPDATPGWIELDLSKKDSNRKRK